MRSLLLPSVQCTSTQHQTDFFVKRQSVMTSRENSLQDFSSLLAIWNFSQIFAHMTRIGEKSPFLLSTSGTSLSECCGYYNIACLFLHEGLSSKIDTYNRHFLLLTHKSPNL